MLYYITTTLARYVAVGSGESRDDCQGNSKSKKQKVITLRRELTLLAFELQPHPSFSAFRRQGDLYTRATQPAVSAVQTKWLKGVLDWGSPHLPFQLFGARATHTPELRNPPCSPCHGFSPGAQERIVDGSARLTGLHYYPYKGQPFFYGGTVRPRNDRAPPKTQLNKTLRAPYRAGLKLF